MLQYYLGMSQTEIDTLTDAEWWLKIKALEHIRKEEAKAAK